MELKLLEKYQTLPPSSWRAKAWEHFSALGMPTKKMSSYQYIPLQHLYTEEFSKSSKVDGQFEEHAVVFVNGKFEKELSSLPESVTLLSLQEAMRSFGSFLNNRFTKLLKEEKDPFVALNMALYPEAAFLYIPPKVVLEKPIRIVHFFDGHHLFPRVHVCLGAFAKASFVTEAMGGSEYFLSQLHDFSLEEGAEVTYTSVCKASHAWHFESLRATLKKSAKLTAFVVNEGAKTLRHDFHVSLMGELAETALYGLSDLRENRQAHINVYINHQAPSCKSSQLFKGVLHDTSKSSFEGKIYVHPEAQKTEAFQLSRHLLLSPHVVAHTKPNLEIFADDVKASHGATIGQLDKEALFYLKSRGIAEVDARNLLINAFSREILEMVEHA